MKTKVGIHKLLSIIMAFSLVVGFIPGMTTIAWADPLEGELIINDVSVAKVTKDDGTGLPKRFETFAEALAAWVDGTTLTLLDNVTVGDTIEISGDTEKTLDLNGYGILNVSDGYSRLIIIDGEDAKLTIVDNTDEHRIHYGVRDLETGRVTEVSDTASESATAVVGGYLTGCLYPDGAGAVFVNGGTLEMTGGAIAGNVTAVGGGVAVVGGGSFIMSGNAVILGNVAVGDDYRSNGGGGVYVGAGSLFEMKGGAIMMNEAALEGGGVKLDGDDAIFKMTGGTITENRVEYVGGGVYASSGTFQVSGNVKITDNFARDFMSDDDDATTQSNVYVMSGRYPGGGNYLIEVIGELGPAAEIGVSATEGVFTDGLNDNGVVSNFASDSEAFSIKVVSGEAKMVVPHSITIVESEHGSITAKVNGEIADKASETDTVVLTATPDDGYRLKGTISVTKPKEIETAADIIALVKDATFEYLYPDEGVEISVGEDEITISISGDSGKQVFSLPADAAAHESEEEPLKASGSISLVTHKEYEAKTGDAKWSFTVKTDPEQTTWTVALFTPGIDGDLLAVIRLNGGASPGSEKALIALSSDNSFSMPAVDVTVSAEFEAVPKTDPTPDPKPDPTPTPTPAPSPSSSPSSGYSGGSSSSSAPTTTTVTVPVSGDTNSVNVSVTISGDTATVSDSNIDAVLSNTADTGTVTIDVSGTGKEITEAVIPSTMVEKIVGAVANANNDADGLEVKLSTGTVAFNATAIEAISDQMKGRDLRLNLDNIKESSLSAAQRNATASLDVQAVYDAFITSNNQRISDFRGGSATVSIPYALKSGQVARGLSVFKKKVRLPLVTL